jgi:hypothetical protein
MMMVAAGIPSGLESLIIERKDGAAATACQGARLPPAGLERGVGMFYNLRLIVISHFSENRRIPLFFKFGTRCA